jgi:hypothetical protein
MLNNNANTRAFAESIGRATAFGRDIVTCDMFLNPQSYGWYYFANDSEATVISPTDPMGAYSYWADYLRDAQALAERHNQDPATYGIMMHFNQGRGCIYLNLVRVETMKSKALDMAENDSVQCPSSITSIDRNERGMIVRLEDEGRTPQPQDEAGRALEDAGRARTDHTIDLEKKFSIVAEQDQGDSLDDWLETNVSFEG